VRFFVSYFYCYRSLIAALHTTVNSSKCRCYTSLALLPKIRLRMNRTRKIKNKIFAILAAPAAIPPKPKMAAIIATIKKITVQRNITFNLKVNKYLQLLRRKMCHNPPKEQAACLHGSVCGIFAAKCRLICHAAEFAPIPCLYRINITAEPLTGTCNWQEINFLLHSVPTRNSA
jgi:hypothetical protein